MNLIAAVDENWGIGYRNRLLVQIPSDQKFFREETMGKILVMGRKTLESLSGGKPLPGRTTFVLSKNQNLKVKGALVFHNVEALLEELKKYPSQDIYVTGGENVYRQLLPYCEVAHITKIYRKYQADTYFPNLDAREEWVLTADSEERTYFDLEYRFLRYEKRRLSETEGSR